MSKPKKSKKGEDEGPTEETVAINYQRLCKNLGIPSAQQLVAMLLEEKEKPPTQFCLSNIDLTPAGAKALFYAIQGKNMGLKTGPFPRYKSYRLWNCNIGDAGAMALSELILQAEELKMAFVCIDLMHNNIGPLGCEALGQSLTLGCNMTMKTIILDHNQLISDDGIIMLFKGLQSNIVIEKLSINYCNITEVGIGHIVSYISKSKIRLMELHLEGNPLYMNGLVILSRGIARNKSITLINLNDIQVCEFPPTSNLTDALHVFGEAINAAAQLVTVQFDRNLIGVLGANTLIPYLSEETNTHINNFTCDQTLPPEIFDQLYKKINRKKAKKKKETN